MFWTVRGANAILAFAAAISMPSLSPIGRPGPFDLHSLLCRTPSYSLISKILPLNGSHMPLLSSLKKLRPLPGKPSHGRPSKTMGFLDRQVVSKPVSEATHPLSLTVRPKTEPTYHTAPNPRAKERIDPKKWAPCARFPHLSGSIPPKNSPQSCAEITVPPRAGPEVQAIAITQEPNDDSGRNNPARIPLGLYKPLLSLHASFQTLGEFVSFKANANGENPKNFAMVLPCRARHARHRAGESASPTQKPSRPFSSPVPTVSLLVYAA
jgi:hypothetical protein